MRGSGPPWALARPSGCGPRMWVRVLLSSDASRLTKVARALLARPAAPSKPGFVPCVASTW
eukprot:5607629-Prymnesium_polylepis.1